MNLRCLIIDDEPLAINVIKNHLSHLKGIVIAGTFRNAIESFEYLQKNEIDLIFLDINMPLMDGFSFLRSIDKEPMVIITTAHVEYAVQSYELEVLDYLVKPISLPRFLKAVNKAICKVNEKSTDNHQWEKEHIFVKINKKKMKKFYLDDIRVIESLKDYIKIITTSDKYIVHQTLSSFTESLPEDKFLRIHRSYTISIDKIEVLEGNSIEIGGCRYPIGRSYINQVKERIFNYAK